MIIHSEQEMLDFAESFTSTGDAAWGTPGGAPATTGEDAAAGPVETTLA